MVRRAGVARRRLDPVRRDRRLLRQSQEQRVGRWRAAFLLAGIVLFHVVFQAEVSLATGFMEETWSRNLLNLMVTPLREAEYGAGVMLFGLAKLAMGVGTVALVAFALFAFDVTSLGFALIPMVALLLVIGLGRRPHRDRPDPARGPGRRDPRLGLHRAHAAALGDLLSGERAARRAATARPGVADHAHLRRLSCRRGGPSRPVGRARARCRGHGRAGRALGLRSSSRCSTCSAAAATSAATSSPPSSSSASERADRRAVRDVEGGVGERVDGRAHVLEAGPERLAHAGTAALMPSTMIASLYPANTT